MKIRMTGEVSGSRDGQPWPAPGMEADVSDAEARALIQGNMASPVDYKADKVLVPPAGVHTPGRVAYGDVNLVEVPADAVADPKAAADAHQAALEGDTSKSVPAGTGVQNPDGSAMTAKQIDQVQKDDQQTAEDLGVPSTEDKAPGSSHSSSHSKSSSTKSSDTSSTTKSSDTTPATKSGDTSTTTGKTASSK